MKLSLLLACAVLAGCAASAELVSSKDRSVVVRTSGGILSAQPVAEAECQKQKLNAQWTDTKGHELLFRCVP